VGWVLFQDGRDLKEDRSAILIDLTHKTCSVGLAVSLKRVLKTVDINMGITTRLPAKVKLQLGPVIGRRPEGVCRVLPSVTMAVGLEKIILRQRLCSG